jgi:hypothetical protein
MPTFRLHLDSVGYDWRDATFSLGALSMLPGDVYKAPFVKLRVERFVWQDRLLDNQLGYTVHLENVDQMAAFWPRAPMPRLVHYGADNSYASPGGSIGELAVSTNWLKQQRLRVAVRDFQDEAFADQFVFGVNAEWFMTLAIEYD